MKKIILFLVIALFAVMSESRGQRQISNNDFIKVDVTKTSYPKKELILQNFMDVEYIALETNNDFLNQGFVQDIGKKIILVKNRIDDGDIFVYDRTGKALRKINHKGPSGKEYIRIGNITLDEDNGEIFVYDLQKILVYDLYGKFKRSLTQKEGSEYRYYAEIFNYDRDNLICYEKYNKEIAFTLISKQDGSITNKIKIPFKKKILLEKILGNEMVGPGPYCSIFPYYNGNWILSEISSDTVYSFLPDYSLRQFLVRTPSVQSQDPEIVLIFRLFSNSYYFMETIQNDFNINGKRGFRKTFMMYDKNEKAMFNYAVYNGDFSQKKEMYLSETRPVNHEIESWCSLEAYKLVESYKNGELKGKLKEIAATLKEDDNPVIMLIKHKK